MQLLAWAEREEDGFHWMASKAAADLASRGCLPAKSSSVSPNKNTTKCIYVKTTEGCWYRDPITAVDILHELVVFLVNAGESSYESASEGLLSSDEQRQYLVSNLGFQTGSECLLSSRLMEWHRLRVWASSTVTDHFPRWYQYHWALCSASGPFWPSDKEDTIWSVVLWLLPAVAGEGTEWNDSCSKNWGDLGMCLGLPIITLW